MNYMSVISMFYVIALNYGTLVEYDNIACNKNDYTNNLKDFRKSVLRIMDRCNAECAVVTIWRDAMFCSVSAELFTKDRSLWAGNPTFHKITLSTSGERMDEYTLLIRRNE